MGKSRMFDRLADCVAVLHGGLLLLDVAGTIAVMRGTFRCERLLWWHWAYLGLAGAKSLSCLTMQSCPLTILERSLRSRGTPHMTFESSFVERYLPWLPHQVDSTMTLLLLVAGLVGIVQAATRNAPLTIRHPSTKGAWP